MAAYGPFLFVNDVVQAVIWTQMGDQAGLNVVHYQVTTGPTAGTGQLSDFVLAWQGNNYAAKLKDILSVNATFQGVITRKISPSLSLAYPDILGNGAGTVAGETLPRQTCGFIRWRNEIPGKRRSGRTYAPFPGEADNTSGVGPTAGYITRLKDYKTSLFSAVSFGVGGVAQLSIWRRSTATASKVVDFVVPEAWATQRRRSTFGRKNVSPFA